MKFYKTDSGELEVMTQSDDDDDDDYNDVINDIDSNPQNHNGGPSNGGGGAGSEGDDIQHEVDFGDDVKNGGKITRRTNRRGRSTSLYKKSGSRNQLHCGISLKRIAPSAEKTTVRLTEMSALLEFLFNRFYFGLHQSVPQTTTNCLPWTMSALNHVRLESCPHWTMSVF